MWRIVTSHEISPGLRYRISGASSRFALCFAASHWTHERSLRLVATAAPRAAVAEPALVLRVTPPRAPRDLLARQRLHSESPQFRGCWAIVVQAAAGFGKTSLLAQWRIEHLSRGAVVGWLSSQADDNPERFVQGLALAVRVGSGRQTFGHTMLEGSPAPALEGITVWLAEVALSAMDVVLIVEDADRLPSASRETLTYVMHNAPPNLRIVVASRPECDLGVADLTAYGQCALVGTETLRFTTGRDARARAPAPRAAHRRGHRGAPAREDRGLAARPSTHAVGRRTWRRPGRADQRDGGRRGRGP